MKKIFSSIVSCMLFLAISLNSIAQGDSFSLSKYEDDDGIVGGWFTFDVNSSFIDFTEINKVLAVNFYPEMDIPLAHVGFGFQFNFGRYLTSMTWNYGTKRVDKDEFRTETVYRDFNFMVFGYDMMKRYDRSVFPFVGLRRSSLEYTYYEKDNFDGTLGNYLNSDLEIRNFGVTSFDLDLGVGFSINGRFLLKLRGGYLIPLRDKEWSIEKFNNSVSTAANLEYPFYVTATIGLGGIQNTE